MERHLEKLDHEEVLVRRGARSGLYTFIAIHSTRRGPALGGCRLWHYEDSLAALRDSLRLSRAMTFKAAVADLQLGGGKGVIMAGRNMTSERRHDALLDFGDAVAALDGRYITAEDVGTSSRDMSLIATRTEHVTGLAKSRGGSGDPSPFTALGVYASMRACCERVFGTQSLKGRSVCVLGLGHVGSRVATLCARDGASLLVSDLDERKRSLAEKLGARWVTPEQAPEAAVDIFAPCALGGLLDEETVPRLRCRIVAGAANNQLAEDHVADLLHARGVLWAPDFVVNAGGLINVAEELGGYDARMARRRVNGLIDTLGEILENAEASDATPLTAAMELARRRLSVSRAAPAGVEGPSRAPAADGARRQRHERPPKRQPPPTDTPAGYSSGRSTPSGS
jgi:leucine dehydrogenase